MAGDARGAEPLWGANPASDGFKAAGRNPAASNYREPTQGALGLSRPGPAMCLAGVEPQGVWGKHFPTSCRKLFCAQ